MRRYVAGVFSLCLFAPQAIAKDGKDVCVVSDGGPTIVFKKVPSLSPGGVIALNGLYVGAGTQGNFPCVGGAAMNAAGTVIEIGITCHTMRIHNSFSYAWTASDQTFAGSGVDDEDGDYVGEDPITISSIPCELVTIP